MKIILTVVLGLSASAAFAGEFGMPAAAEFRAISVPEAVPARVAAGDLTITVDRFTTANQAPVLFAICDSEKCHGLQDKGYKSITAVLIESTVASRKYKISGLAPGEYSLTGYNDLNNNGQLDTGMFSIPKEPMGFSVLDVDKISSFPTWNEVKFTVSGDHSFVTLHLVHNFGL